MAFNSIGYLGFLTVVVVLFWAAPQRFRRTIVLLASMAFYAAWKPVFLFGPLALAICIRLAGRQLVILGDRSRRWLWIGIGAILSILVLFKSRSLLAATAPIGISFYSFEAISYLLDLRQKRFAEPRFWDLVLYLCFWPTVVSGPILRGRELFSQLKFGSPADARLLISGIDRIIWGLVQKNAFANTLGLWVDAGLARGHATYSTFDSWTLVVAYGLQIYFDFCAYSNMAIGSARLIGVQLPENFRYPYHASTPVEFWSRWHMSLSRWIRDYLFFPLNGKYGGAAGPLYFSLITVMALVGLWHGTGWGFLIWGTLHGVYLVIYRLYESAIRDRWPALMQSAGIKGAWRLVTLSGVFLAWVPFRVSNLQEAYALVSSMLFRVHYFAVLPPGCYLTTLTLACLCAVEPYFVRTISLVDTNADSGGVPVQLSRLAIRPLVYAAGIIVFLIFGGKSGGFIYFQF